MSDYYIWEIGNLIMVSFIVNKNIKKILDKIKFYSFK